MNIFRPFIVNLVLLILVIITAFFLFTALPADPVRTMVGVNASEELVDALRRDYGLDQSLGTQFSTFIVNLVNMDLGRSFVTRRSVGIDVWPSMLLSLRYAGLALGIAIIYSLLVSYITFLAGSTTRSVFNIIHAGFVSIPGLITALALGILIFHFNLLVLIDNIGLRQLFMASSALAVYPAAVLSQILMHEYERVQGRPFALAVKGFGFSRSRVYGALFSNAYLPWLAQLSNIAAALLAGSVVIEYVFSLPGLGRLIFQSVIRSDYPMLQGIVLVTSISYILFNVIIESLYHYLAVGRKT